MGARFSAPVQTDPGANPTSYTMGTGSFPGLKRPGRDFDHPPPSSAEVKGRVELYLYSTSGLSWPVIGVKFAFSNTYQAVQRPWLEADHSPASSEEVKIEWYSTSTPYAFMECARTAVPLRLVALAGV